MHWSDKYIGRPYVAGSYDCAALAAEVAQAEFGRAVRLPQDRPTGHFAQSAEIDALQDDYAVPVTDPQEGDPVLMKCRGRLSHIGVWCLIDGEPYILHAMRNAGHVVRHRLRDLARVNLDFAGAYQWR